ncbi:MAG: hypothetical protein ACMZI0_17310 [Symbiopectobacterium sp.]
MMIRHKAITLCLLALFLSGCSNNYVIATKEGQMLLTKKQTGVG